MIEIYTDGACAYRRVGGRLCGFGGWAAVIRYLDSDGKLVRKEEISGSLGPNCTNNIAELTAVIQSLKHIGEFKGKVAVFTDSKYVQNGITDWLPRLWLRNGWKSYTGDPVKNQELWKALFAATVRRNIRWYWVKGHNQNPNNERADTLAVQARQRAMNDMGCSDGDCRRKDG